MRRLGLVWAVAALGAIACSAWSSDNGASPNSPPGNGGNPDSGSDPPGPPPASRGVVLVHAAAFPSFRLCFENYPELRPQPDSNIMPNANVVGVEVGSVIRIEPLARAPGKVFVIDRGQVEASPGEDEQSCGSLICDRDAGSLGDGCLRPGLDYDEIAPITKPLGTDRVELLAIAGCANALVLGSLGVDSSVCGGDFRPLGGNLTANVLALSPELTSPQAGLPVQLVHLAPMLEATRAGAQLDVTFGRLAEGAFEHPIAKDPPLFAAAAQRTLRVERDDSAFYASYGFRIALSPGLASDDGGSDAGTPIVVEQSLAEVQELSAPRDVPADYYRAASNYVLLLLGDPAIEKTLKDGGTNAAYNARRGLHLLALPILDPNDLDAGRDGAADGSTRGQR